MRWCLHLHLHLRLHLHLHLHLPPPPPPPPTTKDWVGASLPQAASYHQGLVWSPEAHRRQNKFDKSSDSVGDSNKRGFSRGALVHWISADFRRFPLVSSGFRWFPPVSVGIGSKPMFRGFQLPSVSVDSHRFPPVSVGFCLRPSVSFGFCWLPSGAETFLIADLPYH